jgi:hypothetical protein
MILEATLRGIELCSRGNVYSKLDSGSLHCSLVLDLDLGRLR